jgi:hypothetical protein
VVSIVDGGAALDGRTRQGKAAKRKAAPKTGAGGNVVSFSSNKESCH